jgi:hypothetical protein
MQLKQIVLNDLHIEGQAFLLSYDMAPPPPPPLSPVRWLNQRHTERLGKRGNLLIGEGGRRSSINHSILSELKYCDIQFERYKKKSFAVHSGCRQTCSDLCQHSGCFKIAMVKNDVDLPPVWLLARQ